MSKNIKDEGFEDLLENEIEIDLRKLLLSFSIGWILMPLLLKNVLDIKLGNSYLLWCYSYINLKVIFVWMKHSVKSISIPSYIFKLSLFGKFLNGLYALLTLFLHICVFIGVILYFYVNQITSIFAFLTLLIQPLCSDISSWLGNLLFFKKFSNKNDEAEN